MSKSSHLSALYRSDFALLTDLYQLTMGKAYWKNGKAEQPSVFHLFFRKNPFGHPYAINAGLGLAIDILQNLRFSTADIQYLGGLKGSDGKALFEETFLHYLQRLSFSCDVDAIPEGKVVFAHEPLIRIKGPLFQAQLIETALLNLINFSTLIATKSARTCQSAGEDNVLEFGLRRAQGIDGGLTASRSAYIGGCHATSNVWAGRYYNIPVRGTHAHSWVMSFDDELEAFKAYADAMPNNCIFLVDTYDSIEGIKRAIKMGKYLRTKGQEMIGVRLDSGDLADLSQQARQLLDEAGFPEAKVVASDSLDEQRIKDLKQAGAKISVWGVGTNLVTAKDQPALGGVYKLASIWEEGQWQDRVKLSNTAIKVSNPGHQQVRRYYDKRGMPIHDVIYDINSRQEKSHFFPMDKNELASIPLDGDNEDLLVPIFREGKLVYNIPDIHSIRNESLEQQRLFSQRASYNYGLEASLGQRKQQLMDRFSLSS